MRRVRTKPESRVASARSFDGGLFEVASQRSTSGTWKRVTLVLTTAQLALRCRKAGISRTFSSIELRTGEERPYGSKGGLKRAETKVQKRWSLEVRRHAQEIIGIEGQRLGDQRMNTKSARTGI